MGISSARVAVGRRSRWMGLSISFSSSFWPVRLTLISGLMPAQIEVLWAKLEKHRPATWLRAPAVLGVYRTRLSATARHSCSPASLPSRRRQPEAAAAAMLLLRANPLAAVPASFSTLPAASYSYFPWPFSSSTTAARCSVGSTARLAAAVQFAPAH